MAGPRAVAHGVIRRGREALLIRIHDPETGQSGWRAPGGGIEFGETAREAVIREIMEETGLVLTDPRFRATFEAFITWRGQPEHEIVFVFEAGVVDPAFLANDRPVGKEASGKDLDLRWVDAVAVATGDEDVYPQALRPILLGQTEPRIRATVQAVFRRGQEILVFETANGFLRAPGGGIEHGEPAEQAIRREIREETGAEIAPPQLLTVVENIFTFHGVTGHEIVHVFECEFVDQSYYKRDVILCAEDDGTRFELRWLPLAEMRRPGGPLVPLDLRDLLVPEPPPATGPSGGAAR